MAQSQRDRQDKTGRGVVMGRVGIAEGQMKM